MKKIITRLSIVGLVQIVLSAYMLQQGQTLPMWGMRVMRIMIGILGIYARLQYKPSMHRSYNIKPLWPKVLASIIACSMVAIFSSGGLGYVAICIFIIACIFRLDNRWIASGALGTLCMTIRYTATKNSIQSEYRSIMLYFLLIATTIRGIIQDTSRSEKTGNIFDSLLVKTQKYIEHFIATHTWKSAYTYGIICILTIIILRPTLRYGYFIRLDHITSPLPWIAHMGDNFFLIPLLSEIRTKLLPMWVFEKVMFIGYFITLGVAGIYMTRSSHSYTAALFGAICMMVNPFIYDRFLDGQMNVYRFVAIIPLWLRGLHRFFRTQNIKTSVILGLIAGGWMGISLHAAYMIAISFVIFGIVYYALGYSSISGTSTAKIQRASLGKWIGWSCIAGICIVVASAYMRAPLLGQHTATGDALAHFDQVHFDTFATLPGFVGTLLNSLSLHGYRGEGTQRFIPSYGSNQSWFMLFLSILALSIWGWVYLRRTKPLQRDFLISFTIISGFALLFGIGIHSGITPISEANQWLLIHLPFYAGMRDTHKRIAFLVPFYAYTGAWGAAGLYSYMKQEHRDIRSSRMIIGYIIALPLLYTPMILGGFYGQIRVQDYPAERYTQLAILKQDHNITDQQGKTCSLLDNNITVPCYSTLILPRHSYMGVSRTQTQALNPATTFFQELHILQPNNVEIGSLYTQSSNPANAYIDSYIGPEGHLFNATYSPLFYYGLKQMGIKYVILQKELDRNQYMPRINEGIANKQIQQVYDGSTIAIYSLVK